VRLGAEIVSTVAEEAWGSLTGPAVRITTPHIPLPAAARLEDHVLPSVDRIVETVSKALQFGGIPPRTPTLGACPQAPFWGEPSPQTAGEGPGPSIRSARGQEEL